MDTSLLWTLFVRSSGVNISEVLLYFTTQEASIYDKSITILCERQNFVQNDINVVTEVQVKKHKCFSKIAQDILHSAVIVDGFYSKVTILTNKLKKKKQLDVVTAIILGSFADINVSQSFFFQVQTNGQELI